MHIPRQYHTERTVADTVSRGGISCALAAGSRAGMMVHIFTPPPPFFHIISICLTQGRYSSVSFPRGFGPAGAGPIATAEVCGFKRSVARRPLCELDAHRNVGVDRLKVADTYNGDGGH